MPFPYLDVAAFKLRSAMRPEDADTLETAYPGFLAQCIAKASSYVNSRLRKRYGSGGPGETLFGSQPPLLIAAGTTPPPVTLAGRPALGSLAMRLAVTTAGPLGVALFSWSSDGNLTTTAGVVTAPLVVLGVTGLAAVFPNAVYALDNVYAAAPPVPDTVLNWIVTLATSYAYKRRGVDPSSTFAIEMKAEFDQVEAEIKEAADSDTGLFDIPTSEDGASAVMAGGPLGYGEASPYTWADLQCRAGRAEDGR